MPTPHALLELELPSRFPAGIRAATTRAGIRSGSGDDLALVTLHPNGTAAAVFTRNRFAAAPIELSRINLGRNDGRVRAILLNAGCANAATGSRGRADAKRSIEAVAAAMEVATEEVLVNSTGIIGENLPIDEMIRCIPGLVKDVTGTSVEDLARAIMTTDSAPKAVERRVRAADGGEISIVGVAKGSGMIHPDMATMIGLVTTDAKIDRPTLAALLRRSVRRTFNRVSVDGDTSTNDSVFTLASGLAGVPPDEAAFEAAFEETCLELSRMIVADGEGASRVLEVEVRGALDAADAHEVAATIGSSLLVRTAIAGGDANWGRIVAALGRTKATFDPFDVVIRAGGVSLFESGEPTGADAEMAFDASRVVLGIDLGAGDASDRHLTCDLTEEYVRINAEYRT